MSPFYLTEKKEIKGSTRTLLEKIENINKEILIIRKQKRFKRQKMKLVILRN